VEQGKRAQQEEAKVTGYLLDTHTWLWAQQRNTFEAGPEFFAQVDQWQRDREVFLSAISILEVARLVAYGQLDLRMPVDRYVEESTRDGGLQLLPLTTRILIESTRLPGDLHRDPADRLLAATSRENDFALVTRDRELLRYSRRGHLRTIAI
jgi:PIN domain nuclease of toxin-antitoxin system